MTDATLTTQGSDLRDYLFSLTMHGVKLGLDNIRHLLACSGNPQVGFPAVHVAGTNGKGSVVAMLDAMMQAAGYHTGRFTSPHLIDLAERFLLDGRPVAEDKLLESIACYKQIADGMPHYPTFFEMNTAMAFRIFRQARVDLGLMEVGMGGRLDSTNVVEPLSTAVTNIGLEHTRFLGDTLELIAGEKGGIFKPNVPAVIGETQPGPLSVLRRLAQDKGCPTHILGENFNFKTTGPVWCQRFSYESDAWKLDDISLGLAGRYQGENAAVAVALAETLQPYYPRLNQETVETGLAQAAWPCRMERVLESPPVIIDVAHNVPGIHRLREAFDCCITLMAISSDKAADQMIAEVQPFTDTLILSTFDGKRSLGLDEIVAQAGLYPHIAVPTLPEAIALGLEKASADRPLLITGSVYTAGEARKILIEDYGAAPMRF